MFGIQRAHTLSQLIGEGVDGDKRKLGITNIEELQEFMIYSISIRNLSTDVTNQFQTVTQISSASAIIVYLAYSPNSCH